MNIPLQLKMSEIIYDIQNKTFLTGRSLSDGSSPDQIANMQSNDDEENEAQVLRSVTMANVLLRNCLAEYLDEEAPLANNEILSAQDNISYTLRMPGNFNTSLTKAIGQVAHQFIVAYAVAEWFAITAKDKTVDYGNVAKECLSVLKSILTKRSRPSRP